MDKFEKETIKTVSELVKKHKLNGVGISFKGKQRLEDGRLVMAEYNVYDNTINIYIKGIKGSSIKPYKIIGHELVHKLMYDKSILFRFNVDYLLFLGKLIPPRFEGIVDKCLYNYSHNWKFKKICKKYGYHVSE